MGIIIGAREYAAWLIRLIRVVAQKAYNNGYDDGYNNRTPKVKISLTTIENQYLKGDDDGRIQQITNRVIFPYPHPSELLSVKDMVRNITAEYEPAEHGRIYTRSRFERFGVEPSLFEEDLILLEELADYEPKRDNKNDYNTDNVERESKEKEDEAVSLRAVREKTRGSIEKLISSEAIQEGEKANVLNIIHDISEAFQKGIPIEEILQQKIQAFKQAEQTPDLSAIPLWQNREQSGMPLDFIEAHYGQYLVAFGAKKDNVFQNQIRSHNPELIKGIYNQLYEEGKGRKVRDFIKTRSVRVDRELENTEYHKKVNREASRLNMAARRRKLKI